MAQPTPYTPSTDFSEDEANNVGGRSTVRTAMLDAELANVETTLDETLENLAIIQRDDGKLTEGLVEIYNLSASALAALGLSFTPRGLWVTATAYVVNDLVDSGGTAYLCVTAHTSGTFATDYAAGKWMAFSSDAAPFIVFTPALTIAATNVQAAIEELAAEAARGLEVITATVAANALTLGHEAGATVFRSSSLASGAVSARTGIATSLVVPSTALLGQSNGVAARLWLAEIDNAGTRELAVINTQLGNGQLHPIVEGSLISTTAMSITADSAGVWYSTSARANVPFRLVGYIENTQATAGQWATAPSTIQGMGPGIRKPGEVVQRVANYTGSVATGTTILPADSSIPQITEGDQYITQPITPTSAVNTLIIKAQFIAANSAGPNTLVAALFQDAVVNALRAAYATQSTANYSVTIGLSHLMQAATSSATTFRIRGGAGNAGTTSFNGVGGTVQMGGVANSFLEVTEVMA